MGELNMKQREVVSEAKINIPVSQGIKEAYKFVKSKKDLEFEASDIQAFDNLIKEQILDVVIKMKPSLKGEVERLIKGE